MIKSLYMAKTQHDSEILADGQQVITACAFIHHNFDGQEKLFMPRRAETKKFLPGVFEMPGGHIDFGEDVKAGLQREIFEEFDVNIEVGDVFGCFTYTNPIKKSHSIEVVYFAKFIDPLENIKLNPEDHSEYTWVTEDEISKLYTATKDENDIEIKIIHKGFKLLNGKPLNF